MRIVHTLTDVTDENVKLTRSRANDESTTHHQRCDQCVPSGRVYHGTGNSSCLQEITLHMLIFAELE